MAHIVRKAAMGMSVLLVAAFGVVIGGSNVLNPFIITFFVILFLWAGVEFYIGFSRSVEGISPSQPLIKISRMLWPLFVIYSWLDFRYGWTRIELPFWVLIILLILCIAGLAIRIWAVIHLGKSFTYDVKRPEGNALVQTGPYRFVRHPSYLGIIILASLPGLIVGSVAGFIGLTLTTVTHTILRLRAEDHILEDEFGDTFLEYKRKTYRLVPFVY